MQLDFKELLWEMFTLSCTALVQPGYFGSQIIAMETGNPHVRASHLSNQEFHGLTFLFLLPSAPINVTGHQHCELSATPAPHPCAPGRTVRSFMRNTREQ